MYQCWLPVQDIRCFVSQRVFVRDIRYRTLCSSTYSSSTHHLTLRWSYFYNHARTWRLRARISSRSAHGDFSQWQRRHDENVLLSANLIYIQLEIVLDWNSLQIDDVLGLYSNEYTYIWPSTEALTFIRCHNTDRRCTKVPRWASYPQGAPPTYSTHINTNVLLKGSWINILRFSFML